MTRRLLRCTSLSGALFTMALAVGVAAEPVEIRVRGHYFSEPATVRITVSVEPNAENRVLRVEADGDRLFRSTEFTLEGDTGDRYHTVEFKNLPAGQYVLRAEVLTNSAVRGVATHQLFVTGVQP